MTPFRCAYGTIWNEFLMLFENVILQVLNYEGGIIELHRLKEKLTNVQADELDRFASLVDTII
jgi:hypothetical protein